MGVVLQKDYITSDIVEQTDFTAEYNVSPSVLENGGTYKGISFGSVDWPIVDFSVLEIDQIFKAKEYHFELLISLNYPLHNEIVDIRSLIKDDSDLDDMVIKTSHKNNIIKINIDGTYWNAGWNTFFYYNDATGNLNAAADITQIEKGSNIYFDKIQDMTFQRIKEYNIEVDLRPTDYDYNYLEYDKQSLTTFDNDETFIRDFFTVRIDFQQIVNNNFENVKESVASFYKGA